MADLPHQNVLEELRASEDVLEAISQQTLMGIVLIQDFRIVYTNERYSEIGEYSLEEIHGWGAQDLLKLGVIDGIIPEPIGGAHRDGREVVEATADKIGETLAEFDAMAPEAIRKARREKFLGIGRLS